MATYSTIPSPPNADEETLLQQPKTPMNRKGLAGAAVASFVLAMVALSTSSTLSPVLGAFSTNFHKPDHHKKHDGEKCESNHQCKSGDCHDGKCKSGTAAKECSCINEKVLKHADFTGTIYTFEEDNTCVAVDHYYGDHTIIVPKGISHAKVCVKKHGNIYSIKVSGDHATIFNDGDCEEVHVEDSARKTTIVNHGISALDNGLVHIDAYADADTVAVKDITVEGRGKATVYVFGGGR